MLPTRKTRQTLRLLDELVPSPATPLVSTPVGYGFDFIKAFKAYLSMDAHFRMMWALYRHDDSSDCSHDPCTYWKT